MAMGGGMNLGGAQFTVTANTSQLERGLQEAEQRARRAGQEIGQAGRTGAMGLLELSRAVEDAQYGFSAIVNNIPGIVTGLGMSAGVAGAASIAAVAINQMIQHWDELITMFGNTAPIEAAVGALEMLNEALGGDKGKNASMWDKLRNAAGFFGVVLPDEESARKGLKLAGINIPDEAQAQQAKEKRERDAEAEAGEKAATKFRGAEQRQRAQDFGAAIDALGGPTKVIQDAINAQIAASGNQSKEFRDKLTREAFRNFGKGLVGEDVGGALGVGLQRQMEGKRQGRIDAEMQRMDRAEAEMGMKRIKQQQQDDQKKQRRDELEQRFALQDKVDAARQKLHAAQMDFKKPFRGDFFDYATSHGEAYEQKQQLQKLEAIRKEQENAVAELKKFNEKQQIARAG